MSARANPHASPRPDDAPTGRVLGVDPGLNVTGYAVLGPSPLAPAPGVGATLGLLRPLVVEAGVIRPGKQQGRDSLAARLAVLHQGLLEILDEYQVDALALEQVHSHTKHPRTAILMAHARGVIMLAASLRGVPVVGYAASRIKKTLTGSGRAPKEQIQQAIRLELGLDRVPEPHDVADACAVALCHFQTRRHRLLWGA